jgi:hypothetical protein
MNALGIRDTWVATYQDRRLDKHERIGQNVSKDWVNLRTEANGSQAALREEIDEGYNVEQSVTELTRAQRITFPSIPAGLTA